MKDLLPVIAGFLLTTVLGGMLGFLLQSRSWNHQHKVQVAEREQGHAVEIFEEISRLMDKRLYRLRLVYWSLASMADQNHRSPLAETRMEEYRQVLYEWNDSINRNLALLQHYFGKEMRNRLDYSIGASFVNLGHTIENWWKSGELPRSDHQRSDMDRQLKDLGSLVYTFNLEILHAIQWGTIGSRSSL